MSEKHEKLYIGNVIREERERHGYTREQLAARADITSRYLAAIELNEKQPSLDVTKRLIHALGMPAARIFDQSIAVEDDEEEHLLRLIRSCSERERKLITALIDAIIDSRTMDKVDSSDDESSSSNPVI